MIRPDASLSGNALARACSHWLRADALWRKDAGEHAAKGTRVHAPLAALARPSGGQVAPLEAADERALFDAGRRWLVSTGRLRPVSGAASRSLGPAAPRWGATPAGTLAPSLTLETEVAFAFDLATGQARRLEDPPGEGPRWYADPDKRAKYGMRPTEIGTRLDLLERGVDEHGAFLFVADYKCHFGPNAADARAQLEACGAVAARAFGIERVRAVGVHLWADQEAEEERLGEPGPTGELELDAHAIDAILDRIVFDFEVPENAAATPGPHCEGRHCPARASCPETVRLAEEALALVPPERLVRRFPVTTTEVSDAAADFQLVTADLFDELAAALRARAKATADFLGEVQRSDGGKFKGHDQTSSSPLLDVPGAIEVFERHGLEFAIERSSSWEAIKREKGQKVADLVREELAAIDAVKVSAPYRVYRTTKPKPVTTKAKTIDLAERRAAKARAKGAA